MFQDVYEWAGQFRTVCLTKDASTFCYPEHLAREMRQLFSWLRERRHLRNLNAVEFSSDAAHLLAELNAIHPFREGNGRAQLTFLALLADRAGRPLALERLEPDVMLDAMIRSFSGNEQPLAAVLEDLQT